MKVILWSIILFVATGFSLSSEVVGAQNGIEDVWRLEAVTQVNGSSSTSNPNPQPGLLIFTGLHYSVLLIPGKSPRQPLTDQSFNAKRLATVEYFISNAATYQVSGSTLTIEHILAKFPGVTGLTLEYELDGETLTLILEAGLTGAPAETEVRYRLTRLE